MSIVNTSIKALVNTNSIPDWLSFLEGGIDNALEQVYFHSFNRSEDYNGQNISYTLTLVSKQKLAVPLIGADVQLVFNPDFNNSSTSSFPVNIHYHLGLLKYVKNFKISTFSGGGVDFIKILKKVIPSREDQLLSTIILSFLDTATDPIQQFTIDVDNAFNISCPYNSNLDPAQNIQAILTYLKDTTQINLWEIALSYIIDSDPAASLEKANNFISILLNGTVTVNDVPPIDLFLDYATPKINGSFYLNVGIEFSRKVLIPIRANGELETDESIKSFIQFADSEFYFSTNGQFGFDDDISLSFPASHPKAQIGKTGITIGLQKAKVDLSRKTNIKEAYEAGYSPDFIGVYAKEATIGLPQEWFEKDNGSTLGIFGQNLLIGTGGISGKIGIEAIGAPSSEDEMFFTLGKKETSAAPRKGFKIGFKQFDMHWQQNVLIESSVNGSLYFPKFKRCIQQADGSWVSQQSELYVAVEALFEQDGDFQITAKPTGGLSFCLENIFIVTIDSLEVGKDDDKAFLCISGAIRFDNNNRLKDILKDPIEVKKMCIYSDGSFEFEAGSIPLPASAKLKLGPTEVSVTNLTFSSEEREYDGTMRKYKYFGFDCGVSAGASGLDLRGDGIAFYFTVDDDTNPSFQSHRFLKIAGIGIDLVIPGNASKSSAAVIINGYLALKEDEYQGSIAFRMPKLKMAGGASMVMKPKVPAWYIDAFLDLAVPIPLGPSGLGIYGFRAMFGKRYIATKEAGGVSESDRWFDYYKTDKAPDGKGMHIGKMATPDETVGASNPFSVGAGLTLATTADDGKVFSLQAFLLLSLPDLIFIQGKANILGERVGLTDDEPPFFAFVAFEPGNSVEFGLGAEFKQRENGGLMRMSAEVEAAYFMRNKNAWYVNFGTKEKPISARILSLFNAYSYLMLSASGIEAGAGVKYGFKKKYGPIKAEVKAYMDIWGTLSFEGAQIGAGIAVGGKVAVSVFGIGFGIAISTTLQGTVPKPFRIEGTVEVCVSVKLLIKKFEKCFDVHFVWKKSEERDDTPILPLPTSSEISNGLYQTPVSGVHIGSGNTYDLNYFGPRNNFPSPPDINKIVPLDTYIDIQFKKALDASLVANKLGGVTNGASGNRDLIPPKPAYKRVTHSYKIEEVEIKAVGVNGGNSWVANYHPYEALTQGSAAVNAGVNPSSFKLGFFQKTGREYNKIRFLSQTPLSYMETSSGGYIPAQLGITSSTLFCQDKERTWHCARWLEERTFNRKQWHLHQGLTLVFRKKDGQVVDFTNVFGIERSLCIPQGGELEIILPASSLSASLKLYTYANAVTVYYLKASHQEPSSFTSYEEIFSEEYTGSILYVPVNYTSEDQAIDKIIIKPIAPDLEIIQEMEREIHLLESQLYLQKDPNDQDETLLARYNEELVALNRFRAAYCKPRKPGNGNGEIAEEIITCTNQLEECKDKVEELSDKLEEKCENCRTLEEKLTECLQKIELEIQREELKPCIEHIRSTWRAYGEYNDEIEVLFRRLQEQLKVCGKSYLVELYERIIREIQQCKAVCTSIADEIAETEAICQELEDKIETLNDFLEEHGEYDPTTTSCPCGTLVHEICWLTEEDVFYNETIPGQDAVEEDFQLAQAAIQHQVAPIWSPDTVYAIRVKVSDSVDGGAPQSESVYFGFRTSGPIGHYPEDKVANPDNNPPGTGLDQKVVSPETNLKFYIDYQKSFPNPSGNILNEKPLYYENPRIGLFYKKSYVYHFFNNWEAYNGLPQKTGQLEMLIKDPVEDFAEVAATDHTSAVFSLFPETEVSWEDDSNPIIPEDIGVYNALRNPEHQNPNYPGANCWISGGDPIIPLSKQTTIIPRHLKPLKLYTAIVRNNYRGVPKEVHRYGFQTSRFRSFAAHINSYHLVDKEGNTRDAVFITEIDLQGDSVSAQTNINRALNIVVNQPNNISNYNEGLAKTYSDPFQRLMEGHFKRRPTHPTNGLQFEFVKEVNTEKVIGLLIESVEPLNNPKIPFNILRPTIKVKEDGFYNYNYFPLFSKDATSVFLMNSQRQINANDLRIHFEYLEWNGQQFASVATSITDNLIF